MPEPQPVSGHFHQPEAPQGRLRSATMRKAAGLTLLLLIMVSLLAWWMTRDTLPDRIRIATAESGGLYYRFGKHLAAQLEERCGCLVLVLATRGSPGAALGLRRLPHLWNPEAGEIKPAPAPTSKRPDLQTLSLPFRDFPGVVGLNPGFRRCLAEARLRLHPGLANLSLSGI